MSDICQLSMLNDRAAPLSAVHILHDCNSMFPMR